MSGGHFDYLQQRLDEVADMLRIEIALARTKQERSSDYSDAFLPDLIDAYHRTKELRVILDRVDYVLSGDDGEEAYRRRLIGDMAEIERDDPSKDEEILREREED